MVRRLLYTAAILALVFLVLIVTFSRFSGPHLLSAGLGIALSLLSILGGYTANRWAFGRSQKVFMATLLGGMFGRLALIALLLVWIATHVNIPLLTFFICLTISYIALQVIEVWTIHGQLKRHGALQEVKD